MRTKLKFNLQTKTRPDLVMASALLHLPITDLEDMIKHELADNPALELADDGRWLNQHTSLALKPTAQQSEYNQKFERPVEQIAACPTAVEQLIAQAACMLVGPDLDVAVYLLQSLDERGFLRVAPEMLASELNMATEDVKCILQDLHQLEPPGIGAHDVRQCLLIQCKHLETKGTDCELVSRILRDAWDHFINQQWDDVAQKLCLTISDVEEARQFMIRNLYPYPLHLVEVTHASRQTLYDADLVIHYQTLDGQPDYKLEIPAAESLALQLNSFFENTLQPNANDGTALSDPDQAWVQNYYERARLFIAALNQRWATLRRIGEYLIAAQVAFLQYGPRHLKPLTRTAVAKVLDLHESTVSRAVSEKIVQLPNGRLMPLSSFFDPTLAAKEAIRHLLAQTDKPLSDREISDHLRSEGLTLARRTVAKYRQQLNIPPSTHRHRNTAWPLIQPGLREAQ